jgi:hypothetical protein
MTATPKRAKSGGEGSGPFNYFNYYTEIEEYFWKKRGAHILVSPLDWAILETWQRAEIPLSAVMKGIDRACESHSRSRRGQAGKQLKTLSYCVDAVLEAAEEEKEAAAGAGPSGGMKRATAEPFSREEIRRFFRRNVEKLKAASHAYAMGQPEMAARTNHTAEKLLSMMEVLESPGALDLEDTERVLTVLEERLASSLSAGASDELLVGIKRDLDQQLAPYRRKMTTEQLATLERRYTQKRLFDAHHLPRLSLFYLS